MKTRNPSLARARGWKLFFPGSLPSVKNASVTEAETVNAGTKFTVRDVAQQQVGSTQRDSLFSQDRSKAALHTREGRVWRPPREELSKAFMQGGSSRSVSSFRPIVLFLFPHLT